MAIEVVSGKILHMKFNNYKAFLWPPEEFLQKIDFSVGEQIWGIDMIPYLEARLAIDLYTLAQVEKIRSLWMNRFRFTHHLDSKAFEGFKEQNLSQGFTQHSLLSVSELIKNTFEHGNKNRPGTLAHLGYWISEMGIIIGVKDEGSFYSNTETVKKFEEKFRFQSTKNDPSGHGIEGLYRDSDFLKVVPEQNALFVGFLFI